MRRDRSGSGRAAAVTTAAVIAAAVLIAIAAYSGAGRKLQPAPPPAAEAAAPPPPLRRTVQLAFDSGSAGLPVDALTQAAIVLADADQSLLVVHAYYEARSNATALAEARTRAVVELLTLAGVPPARIEQRPPAPIDAGQASRTERVEISIK